MARFRGNCGGILAPRARDVAEADVDSDGFLGGVGIQFGMNDGDGAEEKISDVGENGGATGGDEIGGEEFVEFGKGVVDAHGGGEVVGLVGKALEEVGEGLRGSGERGTVLEA